MSKSSLFEAHHVIELNKWINYNWIMIWMIVFWSDFYLIETVFMISTGES